MYSTISFQVDEFKFFKILKNVLAQSSEKLWALNQSITEETYWDEYET